MSAVKRLYGGARRRLIDLVNRMGWIVARTSDFYSPLRPVGELRERVGRWHRPSALRGVRYDLDAIERTLGELCAKFGAEFAALPSYNEIKRRNHGRGFTRVDAQVLYMMLRHIRPQRYLEVGSGMSTYYASLAAQRNAAEGRPMAITAVDPFASDVVRGLAGVEVRKQEAQDLPVEFYAGLEDGDVLFIDSTHIVKVDGEVPYLVLEVLPALRSGLWVHIHDVHFPYNVPIDPASYIFNRRWPLLFTEAMLVQAYLAWNPKVEIVLSTPLLRHFREDALRRLFPDYAPLDGEAFDTHHGSLWLRWLG
jgi:predicted O-methyltransferase YrrM